MISDTEAVYLYGLDIIAQQQAERLYYVHDGLGSVRQLVNTTGRIETNYAYDPFGVPLVGGDVYNPYQYTGEAWDGEVELLYLRARYYQPEVGRFVTKDPWAGDIWRPSTSNKYSYARNNPVSRTDPEGLDGHGPDPLCPECREALPGYSVFKATASALMLVEGWLYERWWIPEELHFGPEHPLTQAVMHSHALAQFRRAWKSPTEGRYHLPWTWTEHSLDERDEGPLPHRLFWGQVAYAREHLRLFLLGDPTGVPLGSLNEIKVDKSDSSSDMVKIEAYNAMGWASGTRIPGTRRPLVENRDRSDWGPGGTVHQYFHWEEPMPLGCWVGLFEPLFSERFDR
ncbi:MAG TPA: RHS repeat-associated core domain-containing protein [Anaerolineae bacterium]|nr:RHS repeat-associated core domain-containing protein [Anaerolineae bacterium]